MGATEIRRSIIPALFLCEMPISVGFPSLRVSAGFKGISGSLPFAEDTYGRQDRFVSSIGDKDSARLVILTRGLSLTAAKLIDHVHSRRANGAGPATAAIGVVLRAAKSVRELLSATGDREEGP